jgi:hypothetical protein
VTAAVVVGYDPGGNGAHGVAALDVQKEKDRWRSKALRVETSDSLHDVLAWLDDICRGKRVVAVGIDTLTEWNTGPAGWRPADLWLRETYPKVAKSVVAPNSIYGAMAINGAAFMTRLAPRFRDDDTLLTEAHPKACYFAMTGKRHAWPERRRAMVAWLEGELEVVAPEGLGGGEDHAFDAAMAALAALRGLDEDWSHDLHAETSTQTAERVELAGRTHYWWPTTKAPP